MALTLYGIPNCDTVKKARRWLEGRDHDVAFHDYKKMGVDEGALTRWIDAMGWERLLNRSGTTFRKLPEDRKTDIDRAKAMALMLANPSMIKRPVIEGASTLLVGFDAGAYEKAGL